MQTRFNHGNAHDAASPTAAYADALSLCADATATHDTAATLEPFASAWLDQWTQAGGSFIRDYSVDNGFVIGWPEYHDSPAFRAGQTKLDRSAYFQALDPAQIHDAGMRKTLERQTHGWGDAAYHGKMRSMMDMLNAVPGGKDAVKAIVRADAGRGLPQREA